MRLMVPEHQQPRSVQRAGSGDVIGRGVGGAGLARVGECELDRRRIAVAAPRSSTKERVEAGGRWVRRDRWVIGAARERQALEMEVVLRVRAPVDLEVVRVVVLVAVQLK